MTINEIFLKDEISMRALNTCTDNDIDTIQELKQFYLNYRTFKCLRNCGSKTDLELTSLCLKYFNIESIDEKIDTKDVSIQKVINSLNEDQRILINEFIKINFSELSIRTKNGVEGYLNGQINLNEISLKMFSKSKIQLSHIRNIGDKSFNELDDFLIKLKEYIFKIYNLNNLDEFIEEKSILLEDISIVEIKKLNEIQINILNIYLSLMTERLSVRSKNAICEFLENDISINSFKNKIFSHYDFKFIDLQNIGKASVIELDIYLIDIKNYIKKLAGIENENELIKLNVEINLKKVFNNNISVPNEILETNSIFRLVDYLINESIVLDKVETVIFKNSLNVYNNSRFVKLNELANDIGLTKERIRQIRVDLLEKTILRLKFIEIFEKRLLSNYFIDFNQNHILISDDNEQYINYIDGTRFSNFFITIITSIILEHDYSIIGCKEDVFFFREFKDRNRHNWSNLFLIKKELIDVFNFEKFIEDIEERIKEEFNETYKFNFKSYLSRFIKHNEFVFVDEIFAVCEMLIKEEFNLFLTVEENIVFERSKYKTLPEYAFEALNDLGVPSHINDIDNHVRVLNPTFDKKITNANLKREFGFVPFGRKSVFGLKKWESENSTIKSGTIRSIAEEFLIDKSEPMHISKISDYVLQYRPESNEKSIIYNLKMEDNNRFLFFKNSFIGLKNKQYHNNQLEILDEKDKIEKKTWEENYQELIRFIENNNRLPSSMSCPIEEIKINRWLNVQRSKINKNILEDSKKELVQHLISNYNVRINKVTLFRNEGYKKLADFIKKESRLPTANKSGESQLYAFFYKQRKLFEESKLDIEEETKFIEIAKLIQRK